MTADTTNGVPTILVGTWTRTAEPNGQSTAPAGVVAQWIAVKQDDA